MNKEKIVWIELGKKVCFETERPNEIAIVLMSTKFGVDLGIFYVLTRSISFRDGTNIFSGSYYIRIKFNVNFQMNWWKSEKLEKFKKSIWIQLYKHRIP